jgi:CheY-like chemotaxis protein
MKKNGNLTDLETNLALNKGTILYIEDNESNIELVVQIFSSQRSEINLITEIYGKQAVSSAIQYQPNLILLDLDLPDIHGSEVLKRLQAEEKTRGIPVIIISADAGPKQIEKLLKAGAKNYLTKPLDINDFLKVTDEWL